MSQISHMPPQLKPLCRFNYLYRDKTSCHTGSAINGVGQPGHRDNGGVAGSAHLDPKAGYVVHTSSISD